MLTEEQIAEIRARAEAATPQNFDTASDVYTDGEVECHTCGGDGFVAVAKEYLNYDDVALGVQFYGIGEEPEKAEAYYRAVPPAVALALLSALEAANKRADEVEALVRLLEDAETVEIMQTLRARVTELEEQYADKVDGLESDLSSAVDVLFRRGDDEAREWIRLNYPTHYERFVARAALKGAGHEQG